MKGFYASIDIGTNTAKLLIAEVRGEVLHPVFQRSEAPRVGRNLAATGLISDESFQALSHALMGFTADIRDHGAFLTGAVATQAFRVAANGPELLAKASDLIGCEARIIAGPEESRLGWLAVANRHPLPGLAVLDIGGGSTEATRKGGGFSTPIGAVMLLEACGPDAAACRARASEAFIGDFSEWRGQTQLAAVGGTATALAMLELGLTAYDSDAIEGLAVARRRVSAQIDRLAGMDKESLLKLPGMDKGRADILMPGLCILEAFLDKIGAAEFRVSDRGIRYGITIDWLRKRAARPA